ncbi:MAG: ECF-type sigma factor [Thermoanaerobaculia bacterium]|nr:ECF-type sigma factor [Thermoanaerobaculia bacterium]
MTTHLPSSSEHSQADLEELFALVYSELHRIAQREMGRELSPQTLQPTALVNEAYLRLLRGAHSDLVKERSYFFGAATRAMRRILVERARRRSRDKRGGDQQRVTISDVEGAIALQQRQVPIEDVLTIDELLEGLAAKDPAMARLIELRFFGGLTMSEAALVMETSKRRLFRLWRAARAWMAVEVKRAKASRGSEGRVAEDD